MDATRSLQVVDAEGLVSPAQAARGFARLKEGLPDLTCDVPNAGELLEEFVSRAKADGVLAADA